MADLTAKKITCFVCESSKSSSTFWCPSCISKGDFATSKVPHSSNIDNSTPSQSSSRLQEKFCEKKSRLWNLEEEHRSINQRLEKLLEESRQLELIEQSISEYEFKISTLQKLINEMKSEQVKSSELSRRLAVKEKALRENSGRMDNHLEETRKAINQVSNEMKQAGNKRERLLSEIKAFTKESILQLKHYIFPYHTTNGITSSYDHIINCEGSDIVGCYTSSTLRSDSNTSEDSTSLTNSTSCEPPSMDSWSNVHFTNQTYNIVESWIPRDSVSRAYCEWSLQQRENSRQSPTTGSLNEVKTKDNDAYRISAALALITQMLTVISYYVDVRFPKKLSFVEFFTKYSDSGSELLLNDEELLHKVAKLNANIIYLCLSQKVQPHLIEPAITGKNLSLLLDPSITDLGTIGQPVYIDSETHLKVEKALFPDYSLLPDLDAQEYTHAELYDEEFNENDWESVHSSTPYVELVSSQQTASISSGIVSSFAATALNAVTSFIRKK